MSPPTSPIAKTLAQIGLSEKQAVVYEALLNLGKTGIGKLLPKVPYKRGNTYDILDELKEKGLISETEERGKKTYIIEPPARLKTLLNKREQGIQQAKKSLTAILPKLKSDYNLVAERPNIQFFEGINGIKQIYNDMLSEKKDILLIRARYEPVFEQQIVPIVKDFIKNRVRQGQRVTALTPLSEKANPSNRNPEDDKKILMERTWIEEGKFDAPVEINIYDDKVALLSFGKELIGTIIESKQIAQSFKQIFYLARQGAEKTKLPVPVNR